jgi:hypothetical protein
MREERRKFQRLRLRLPISQLSPWAGEEAESTLRTANVSAGGMYFECPAELSPEVHAELSFELAVPPGDGYASSDSRIRGSGRVVSAVPCEEGQTGVAVQFTQPLALNIRM